MAYPNTQLFINGKWRAAHSGKTIEVLNPATEETIGIVAHAEKADLDEALAAAAAGFKVWRAVSAFDRCKVMRKAAAIMRERNDEIFLFHMIGFWPQAPNGFSFKDLLLNNHPRSVCDPRTDGPLPNTVTEPKRYQGSAASVKSIAAF